MHFKHTKQFLSFRLFSTYWQKHKFIFLIICSCSNRSCNSNFTSKKPSSVHFKRNRIRLCLFSKNPIVFQKNPIVQTKNISKQKNWKIQLLWNHQKIGHISAMIKSLNSFIFYGEVNLIRPFLLSCLNLLSDLPVVYLLINIGNTNAKKVVLKYNLYMFNNYELTCKKKTFQPHVTFVCNKADMK